MSSKLTLAGVRLARYVAADPIGAINMAVTVAPVALGAAAVAGIGYGLIKLFSK